MRGLLVLVSVLALLVLVLVWKFAGTEPVQAAPPPDEDTGRVVVGLAADDPAALPKQELAQPPPAEPPYAPPPAAAQAPAEPADSTAPVGRRRRSEPLDPRQEAPAAGAGVRYTVRRGDTLYSIVRRAYGVAPASLIAEVASVNGLEDPAALDVGRELVLPEIAGHRPPEDPGGS